jgi:predicted ATPase
MRLIVLTGAPGTGKTTLLGELARRGFATVPDTARAFIAARRAAGLPPRPAPDTFARALFDADRAELARLAALDPAPDAVFLDRCALESLGMLHEAGAIDDAEVRRQLATLRFHDPVFLLPPWPAIYVNDSERDQSFDDALRVDAALRRWYTHCGWRWVELAPDTVERRADRLLQGLATPDIPTEPLA